MEVRNSDGELSPSEPLEQNAVTDVTPEMLASDLIAENTQAETEAPVKKKTDIEPDDGLLSSVVNSELELIFDNLSVDIQSDISNETLTIDDPNDGDGDALQSPPPTLAIDSVTVNEDAGSVTLTVTRSGGSIGQETTVEFQAVDGSANNTHDYTALSGEITFAPGELTKMITIDITNDMTFEGNENFTVELLNPENGVITNGVGNVTIIENDPIPTISIEAGNDVAEGTDTTASFTITLSNPSDETVTVDFSTVNSDAEAGEDFTGVNNHAVIFAPGETSKTITIDITDNDIYELTEQFGVVLSNPSNGILDAVNYQSQMNINDDEDPPAMSIADNMTVNEADGIIEIEVTLNGTSSQTITADVSIQELLNGADNIDDFTLITNSIEFEPGETSTFIQVQINNDNVFELPENFKVTLSNTNPTNITIVDNETTITINDNETQPEVAIINPDTITVNEDAGTATFTVELSGESSQTVTVDFRTVNSTATAGEDFTDVTSETITFNPGETSKTITIDITDDNIFEPGSENFTVELFNAVNTNITTGEGTGTVTINPSDSQPIISIDNENITISEESGEITYTVTLSNPSSETITVKYSTNDGTATAGNDFTDLTDQIITFAPGETSKQFTVTLNNDDIFEGANENFAVVLSEPTNATIATGTSNITLTEAETQPTVSINETITVDENAASGVASFTISLSGPSDETITVDYSTMTLTATSGTDFAGVTNETVTFAPGETSKQIMVNLIDDSVHEGNEQFKVTLSNPINTMIDNANSTATITDNETAPTMSIQSDQAYDEASGTITIQVTLSGQTIENVTADVSIETLLGGATSTDDFTLLTNQVSFTPGQTTANIQIQLNNDDIYELPEDFKVKLSNADPSTVAIIDGEMTVTINDDQSMPEVSIADPDAVIIDESAGTATFTVELSGKSSQTVTVDFKTVNGTATADEDFTGVTSQTITFNPGETSKTITIDITDDSIYEPNTESFTVELLNPTNTTIAAGNGTGTVTINPSDLTPTLTVSDSSVDEDVASGQAIFTISLSHPATGDVTVNYVINNGSATNGDDFTHTIVPVVIPQGQTSVDVTIDIINDNNSEGTENFSLQVVSTSGPAINIVDDTGVMTINDDDQNPVPISNILGITNIDLSDLNTNSEIEPDITTISGLDYTGLGDISNNGQSELAALNNTNSSSLFFMDTQQNPTNLNIPNGFADTIRNIGDFNGDGIDDTLVINSSGNADIYFTRTNLPTNNNDLTITNLSNAVDIQSIGDINGDSIDDILIANSNGTLELIKGDYEYPTVTVSSNRGTLPGFNYVEQTAMKAGDINGDGFGDAIITYVTGTTMGGANIYESRILHGNSSGNITLNQTVIAGNASALGDINGDGIDDYAYVGNGGSNNVVLGGSGTTYSFTFSPLDQLYITSAGDFNGDGLNDFIYTVYNGTELLIDGKNIESYVIFGSESPGNTYTISIDNIETSIKGSGTPNKFGFHINNIPDGHQLESIGDIDGDGFDDLLISGASGSQILYGQASDLLYKGTDGNDLLEDTFGLNGTLNGGAGNDILDGFGGSDTLLGGIGNDKLIYDSNDLKIDGGHGTDTLLLNNTLDLSTISNGQLSRIERFDMSNNNTQETLTLRLDDVLDLDVNTTTNIFAQARKVLFVDGNNGDEVNIGDDWNDTLQDQVDPLTGNTYHVYMSADQQSTLLISTSMNIIET